MSLQRLNPNDPNLSNSIGYELSYSGQPLFHQVENMSAINSPVFENRLFQKYNGEIGIIPKSPAELLGEIALRPLIDGIVYISSKIISMFSFDSFNKLRTVSWTYSKFIPWPSSPSLLPVASAEPCLATKDQSLAWEDRNMLGDEIVKEAKKWRRLNTTYVLGGSDPRTGVDCSGFTKYIYKTIANVELHHKADLQWKKGPGSLRELKDLVPGDLIFFKSPNEPKRKATHVGIYLGNNKVISATNGKTNRVVNSSISVFGETLGGRHIL